MMDEEMCEFIRNITKHPTEKTSLRVRDFLQLRQHIKSCDICKNRVDRVCDEDPREQSLFGIN